MKKESIQFPLFFLAISFRMKLGYCCRLNQKVLVQIKYNVFSVFLSVVSVISVV